ncbi:MAG: glycosyltransferase [Acidimicrobiia bacterium]
MGTFVSLVVPVYNEDAVLGRFGSELFDHVEPDWEIVFVDDGSVDRTPEILAAIALSHPNVRVVCHPHNRGIGAALRTGVREARGDIVVTMDSDLSHPFDVVRTLVDACGEFDAAYGSRLVAGGGMVGVPWFRQIISYAGNAVFRLLFWSRIRDLTTGFRAYRSAVVRDLPLIEDGYPIQLEISVHLLARGATVTEVPLVLENRAAGESKMKYLRLIPRYVAVTLRLLGVRWALKGRHTSHPSRLP